MKILISSNASDLLSYNREELKQSIKASEGRTILAENVATRPSYIGDITNAKLSRGFGADLILLNGVDVLEPNLPSIENQEDFVNELKNLVGRPIGVNLVPVDTDADIMEEAESISRGRTVNEDSLKKIEELGMDFVCFTGNHGTGVTNKEIVKAIQKARANYSGLIIAGKMHSAGVDEPVYSQEAIVDFIKAGADIILIPSIGSVPGFDKDDLKTVVRIAHKKGALVMTAIGTSQEGARPDTIRQMAIENTICGVDIQHIGDAGYSGLAPVENIFEMSVAIRGIRHTVSMVARSINR
ncbi:DUF7916 family protein [Helcococcus bovis]|uniref:DUF7916 family protein n=1 Tax=Helcococcus bovis TaxID=3153252 RepID=UPI0038B76B94